MAEDLFERHRERLERAVAACATRTHYAPFVESPSRKLHPEGAHEEGRARFEARLNASFPLEQPGTIGRVGEEVSPYTQEPLGIDYPALDPEEAFASGRAAMKSWTQAGPRARVGVCLEILDRWSSAVFENAYATMHTAGQAFILAFAGSGASSLERGLEALAYAHEAMRAIPEEAVYERSFQREAVRLEKRYRLRPRGVAVVIACGSYPAWNAYPAILANLATGNPVILKPHPGAILPLALAVSLARDVIEEAGFDPNLLLLAADSHAEPLTKQLLAHPQAAIVDFTGSQAFGRWIEEHCRRALVYTETSGCNAVVIESSDEPQALLAALAQGLALFSAQMCTAPQNVFVPRSGVRLGAETVDPAAFCGLLNEALDALLADPARAAGVCGAVQNPAVLDSIEALRVEGSRVGTVVRDSQPYAHPEFPKARVATPLIVQVEASERIYRRERYGPMAFVVVCDDREQALARACEDARESGSIANYAYSADAEFVERVQDAFADAGASVGINLTRQLPIHFTAAFSDFHVTGLNPAGNACLTDAAFVANRFRIVQSKIER